MSKNTRTNLPTRDSVSRWSALRRLVGRIRPSRSLSTSSITASPRRVNEPLPEVLARPILAEGTASRPPARKTQAARATDDAAAVVKAKTKVDLERTMQGENLARTGNAQCNELVSRQRKAPTRQQFALQPKVKRNDLFANPKSLSDVSSDVYETGGCFEGQSLVHMADGTFIPVSTLKSGDEVKCGASNEVARVVCLMGMHTSKVCFVRFPGGLAITPSHPILHGDEWTLPKEIHKFVVSQCCMVYNVLLISGHTMLVNGITCATMGHRRTGHIAHSFWGDWGRISDCLEEADPDRFRDGFVEIKGIVRQKEAGSACGLKTIAGGIVTGEYTFGVPMRCR